MRKFILLTLVFVVSGLFSQDMDDAIILHPKLSYRVESEGELKVEDYHLFGDKVKSNGVTKTVNDSTYIYLEKNGKGYYTYFYFVIQNSVEGVILEDSFLYSSDDLSTITAKKIDRLTFVAVDKGSLNKDVVKVSYLAKNENGWLISKGWVKKSSISTEKDNWGTAIKYFNATQAESKDARESILGTVFMFNKNTVFGDLIQKMLDEGHLNVKSQEYKYDELFAGTDEPLFNRYYGAIYKEAGTKSEVLFEGESVITLMKKLSSPVVDGEDTMYWYYVNNGEIEGWILR